MLMITAQNRDTVHAPLFCHVSRFRRFWIQLDAVVRYFRDVWNTVELALFTAILLNIALRSVVNGAKLSNVAKDLFVQEGFQNIALYLWAYETQVRSSPLYLFDG